ncbi:MAG: hypothetical protein WCW66_03770 [Patescibacteria group bacterium]
MQKHKKKLIILSSVVIFSVFVFLAVFNINKVVAAQPPWDETNVTGWSWSGISTDNGFGVPEFSHIGWFSNNCYNYFDSGLTSRCGTRYGVQVDPVTGELSGYSWNGIMDDSGAVTGVGWLDFAPQPFPGPPYYSARIEPVGTGFAGQISGWARIKSIKDAGEELGYEDWGWILMGPAPANNRQFGVEINFNYDDGAHGGQNCVQANYSCPLSGYAWAGGYLPGDQLPSDTYENVTTGLGWINFGPEYPLGTSLSSYDSVSGDLGGYAWVGNNESLGVNIGWIALNCSTTGNDCGTSDFKVNADSATGDVSGYAWIGESNGGIPIGRIDFDPNPYPAIPNHSAKVLLTDQAKDEYNTQGFGTYETGDAVGWARLVSLQKEGVKGHFENWGWVKLHATSEDALAGVDYGVSMQIVSGIFEGEGWSGGGTVCIEEGSPCYNNSVGLGWISFDDFGVGEYVPSSYIAPFLETVQGDIYSTTGVGSNSIFDPSTNPLTRNFYNSTFLIQTAGTIQRYTSENNYLLPSDDGLRPPYDPLIPPLASNKYTNVMGKLDVVGITTVPPVVPLINTNKFGNIVETSNKETISEYALWESDAVELAGKVYHFSGNLTVDVPIVIKRGNPDDQLNGSNASGTIVVDGDLNIERDISYYELLVNEHYTELNDIPSVVWIVKGNVNISPNVKNVAGNFVVVGSDIEPDGVLDNGTGGFYTGAGDDNLVISGLVVAHELFLQRSGIGTLDDIQASERIFYDGRIIINTPPGVGDFAKALPVVREVAPIEITTP